MRLYYGDLDLTDFPYAVEFGLDAGAPQNVSEALAFLLQDGEVELSTRASNRTMAFTVQVEGADLAECADAEAALIAETEKPLNTVTIDPEDFGPPSVYEVFRGQVTLARDDNGEMARLRRYTVSVRASAFVRSETLTVTPALATTGTPTTVNVDNGSSATGWTASTTSGTAPTATVVSGAVTASTNPPPTVRAVALTLTRTGSIATSATPYLVVDWKANAVGAPVLSATGDGVTLTKVAEGASPTAGYTRTQFKVLASTVTALALTATIGTGLATSTRTFSVDNIDRTDAAPTIGGGKQLFRSIAVDGSVRTPGSIAIEHPTAGLGDVLAIFWPEDGSGFSPELRQYRSGGGTVTSDSTMASGFREPLNSTTLSFDIPATSLGEAGSHRLKARLGAASAVSGTLTWAATTLVNGVNVGPVVTGTRPISADTNYQIVTVGRLGLPTRDLDEARANAVVRITLTSTVAVLFDDGWLVPPTGTAVQASCGSGTASSGGPANRMYINAPTVDRPRPVVRCGFAADGSDSFYPSALQAWDFPEFKPPTVKVFTVTTGTTNAAVSFSHYSRWHTNAAS